MSEADDLLSLWRAYGKTPGCCAVGFTSQQLEEIAARNGIQLVQCVYDTGTQRQLLSEFVARSLAEVDAWASIPAYDMLCHNLMEQFWRNFAILAARIKDPSFSEEREWRLVAVPEPMRTLAVQVREGASSLIPYVEVPMADAEWKLPLYHIIVGPNVAPERACQAVLSLFAAHGQSSPKLAHPSIVPFRTW
jgi:hypothetical protein